MLPEKLDYRIGLRTFLLSSLSSRKLATAASADIIPFKRQLSNKCWTKELTIAQCDQKSSDRNAVKMEGFLGIHHVAILSRHAEVSTDFYERVLGLQRCHDIVDTPLASTATFCLSHSVEGLPPAIEILAGTTDPGRNSRVQVAALALSVPSGSTANWLHHLRRSGVSVIGRASAFREEHLCFADPDGLSLSLVEDRAVPMKGLRGASTPIDAPILRFRSVELQVVELSQSAKFLTDILGFKLLGREGPLVRFGSTRFEHSDALDLLCTRKCSGEVAGTIERVAWRVADKRELTRLGETVRTLGINVNFSVGKYESHVLTFIGPDGLTYIVVSDTDTAAT